MEIKSGAKEIIKETFPSEVVSVTFNFFVGLVLVAILDKFTNFVVIILMVPPLLSIRGNISQSYCARVARDLIIGCYNKKTMVQNVVATMLLILLVCTLISIFTILLIEILQIIHDLTLGDIIAFPFLVMILTSSISMTGSTFFSIFIFKKGLNPNNILPGVWTSVDDLLIVINIYLSLLILGVS